MIDSVVLLVICLIILGSAVYLFLKGTFIKAFTMAVAAVCAAAIALGFFEVLSNTLIGFAGNNDLLVRWGPLISYVLLFIVAFAVLQTAINLLTRHGIDLGFWPERIGRAACGAFLGFTVSRVLVAVLVMSFLPGLQTGTLGTYLGYKGINPPKKTQQKKTDTSAAKRDTTPRKEAKSTPGKGKLSDTSKSVLGPDFE
jgi:hypothetical protein